MSASPFPSNIQPYLKVAEPAEPLAAESASSNNQSSAVLEWKASDAGSPDQSEPISKASSWWTRLLEGFFGRSRREERLANELQDLRASYAGLLHTTEDLRERMDGAAVERKTVEQALSPFPSAVAGIEKIKDRQEEAGEVLDNIRERLMTTAERDEALMTSLGFLNDGVGDLKGDVGGIASDVGKVNDLVSNVVQKQDSVVDNLGSLSSEMTSHFEDVKAVTEERSERIEQSNEDVLLVLKNMQTNHQRGLWIFASLLGALFVILVCFAAQFGSMAAAEEPELVPALEELSEESSGAEMASDSGAQVLEDGYDF